MKTVGDNIIAMPIDSEQQASAQKRQRSDISATLTFEGESFIWKTETNLPK
jgi:hypothetical protein